MQYRTTSYAFNPLHETISFTSALTLAFCYQHPHASKMITLHLLSDP